MHSYNKSVVAAIMIIRIIEKLIGNDVKKINYRNVDEFN